jgi:hypothetical protein
MKGIHKEKEGKAFMNKEKSPQEARKHYYAE